MENYNIDNNSRDKVYYLIAFVAVGIVFGINQIENELVKDFATPSGLVIYGILLAIYNKYLWKTWLGDLICPIPNLEGEWTGQLERPLAEDGEQIETRTITLSITQNWQKISLVSEGQRTRSISQSVFFSIQNKRNISLKWLYFAEDKNGQSEENLYGEGVTTVVYKETDGVKKLSGKYYSSKKRKGPYEVTLNQ